MILALEGSRNKHMISALEGTFERLPYDNWIFERLPYYVDLATKTFPQPDHAKVTTRSGTMKGKKAEEEKVKSKNKHGQERRSKSKKKCTSGGVSVMHLMQRARDAKHLRREAWRVFTADCEERGKKYVQAQKDKAATSLMIN